MSLIGRRKNTGFSPEAEAFVETATRMLLESRYAPTSNSRVHKLDTMLGTMPSLVERLLDDHYTRNFLGNVHDFVRRTMRLDSLIVRNTPSNEANLYIQEATRNYIFGLWRRPREKAKTLVSGRFCVTDEVDYIRMADQSVVEQLVLHGTVFRELCAQTSRRQKDFWIAPPNPRAKVRIRSLLQL